MFKILKNLTKRDLLFVLCSFVFIVSQVWLDLKLPEYLSEITILVQTEAARRVKSYRQADICSCVHWAALWQRVL